MRSLFKVFLCLSIALAVASPFFVGAAVPECSLSCGAGQVCQINSTGSPQCVPNPFPAECSLSCGTGQVCQINIAGNPECVPAQPNPLPPNPNPNPTPASSTGSTYRPADLPINTNLPLRNPIPISGAEGQGPAGVIGNFYSFAFLIAGFLAFVMIVYGGVRYTFSAGNASAKDEAKDAIKQALLGLGLLLVAYLILRTINPDLTQLRMPTLDPYVPPAPAVGTPPAVLTGYGCTSANGATYCSERNDCSDIYSNPDLSNLCAPGTCAQRTSCQQAALIPQCSSGACVNIVGYPYKNGHQADTRMVSVLNCMLGRPGVPLMRITEAMPISSPHQSSCHNNGCCVDMTLASKATSSCTEVQSMISAAQACGATRVLNEYYAPLSTCGGANTELSTGVHLHIVGC